MYDLRKVSEKFPNLEVLSLVSYGISSFFSFDVPSFGSLSVLRVSHLNRLSVENGFFLNFPRLNELIITFPSTLSDGFSHIFAQNIPESIKYLTVANATVSSVELILTSQTLTVLRIFAPNMKAYKIFENSFPVPLQNPQYLYIGTRHGRDCIMNGRVESAMTRNLFRRVMLTK